MQESCGASDKAKRVWLIGVSFLTASVRITGTLWVSVKLYCRFPELQNLWRHGQFVDDFADQSK